MKKSLVLTCIRVGFHRSGRNPNCVFGFQCRVMDCEIGLEVLRIGENAICCSIFCVPDYKYLYVVDAL